MLRHRQRHTSYQQPRKLQHLTYQSHPPQPQLWTTATAPSCQRRGDLKKARPGQSLPWPGPTPGPSRPRLAQAGHGSGDAGVGPGQAAQGVGRVPRGSGGGRGPGRCIDAQGQGGGWGEHWAGGGRVRSAGKTYRNDVGLDSSTLLKRLPRIFKRQAGRHVQSLEMHFG